MNAVVKLYYPFLLSPLPPWYIARLWRPQLKAHQTNIFGSETAATYQLEPQSSHRVQVDLAFTGFPPSVFPPTPLVLFGSMHLPLAQPHEAKHGLAHRASLSCGSTAHSITEPPQLACINGKCPSRMPLDPSAIQNLRSSDHATHSRR